MMSKAYCFNEYRFSMSTFAGNFKRKILKKLVDLQILRQIQKSIYENKEAI